MANGFEVGWDNFVGPSMGAMEYTRLIFVKAPEGGAQTGLNLYVRVSGTWNAVLKVWMRLSGTWTEVTPYIRTGGIWYKP